MTVYHEIFGLGYGFIHPNSFLYFFVVLNGKILFDFCVKALHILFCAVYIWPREANTIPTFKKLC